MGGPEPASRGSSGGRRFARVRSVLVAGQVALALVLLVGAVTLAASVYRLARVDLEMETERIMTFDLNLPHARYNAAVRARFHVDMSRRLARLPGVRSAAAVSWPPAGGSAYGWGTHPHSGPLAAADHDPRTNMSAGQRVVAGDYFATLGVSLLEGRLFDARDTPADSPAAAVVSRSVAERLFPGTSALGHEIHMGGQERVVVGVVEDVAQSAEGDRGANVYHWQPQYGHRNWSMTYLLATETSPLSVLSAVRRAVAEVDPRLVVHDPASLEATLDSARGRRSFAFTLTAVFAALALALALLGVYGVLAYLVAQRTREIGIRIALGAGRGRIARDVVTRGLVVTVGGLALGIAGALAAGHLLESLVFETETADPWILASASAAMALAAVGAALVPAVRAANVEPRVALAEE